MKPKYLVWIRRGSQVFFLGLFLFLLVESRLPQDIIVDYTQSMGEIQEIRIQQPVTFFFQLDPLVWLTSLISAHLWIKGSIWALAVLGITLLLGRIFCGFICPFGTIHHMLSHFKSSLKGEKLFFANRKTTSQKIKYALLVSVLFSSLLGLNIAGWIDPVSFLFRSLALAVIPGLGNSLAEFFGLRQVFQAAGIVLDVVQLFIDGALAE